MIRNISYFFRRLYRLCQFIPRIWNSFDWDYKYAVDLFFYQLNRIADELEKTQHGVNNQYYANRIRLITKLKDKVYNEDYIKEVFDTEHEKYGENDIFFADTDNPKYKEFKEGYEKKYPPEVYDKILEERRVNLDVAYKKQKRAHKLLWDMIEHRIQYFWD